MVMDITLRHSKHFGKPGLSMPVGRQDRCGYTFAMSVTPASPTTPASFFLTATPQRYPKTGRLSFFMDTLGEMRGGDKNGRVATATDPYIDSCALAGNVDIERCTIQAMSTLHGAEMTYISTYGNGQYYGSLSQLGEAVLITQSRNGPDSWIQIHSGLLLSERRRYPHLLSLPQLPRATEHGITIFFHGHERSAARSRQTRRARKRQRSDYRNLHRWFDLRKRKMHHRDSATAARRREDLCGNFWQW